MDQNRLPFRKAHLAEEGVEGRHIYFGNGPGIFGGDPSWDPYRRSFMHRHILGVPTTPQDAHDPVALFPKRHLRPFGLHRPGVLQPRDILRGTGRCRITPDPLDHIGPIQPGSPHSDQDLFRPRLWPLHLPDLHYLRSTELGNNHRPHGVRHRSLFGIVCPGARLELKVPLSMVCEPWSFNSFLRNR